MPYTLKRLPILATAILFLLLAFAIIRLAQRGWIRRSENLTLTQGRSKRLVRLPVQVNRLIPNSAKSEFGEEQTMKTKNSRLQFRQTAGCILAAILVFVCSSWCWAANDRDIPHIDATVKFDQPPEWAVQPPDPRRCRRHAQTGVRRFPLRHPRQRIPGSAVRRVGVRHGDRGQDAGHQPVRSARRRVG